MVSALKDHVPNLHLRGLGGEHLAGCGLISEVALDKLAVMGFAEVIRLIPFFFRLLGRLTRIFRTWQPDRVLLVDYPGLNLRLARKAKRMGIPVTYYVSPQVWAWGSGRILTIRDTVDQMLVLFDFEKTLYDEAGVDAVHVGHPLVDEVAPTMTAHSFRREVRLDDRPLLALLPGSRPQEVRRHLPVMIRAAAMVEGVSPVVGLAPGIDPAGIPAPVPWTHRVYDLLACADAAVVASGTATLEAALLGTPLVVVYRTHALNALLARRILTIPYVAMANVVAGRQIVPECLQGEFTPPRVAAEVTRILRNDAVRQQMRRDLKDVARRLGPPGASMRAAQVLASRLRP